MFFLPIFRRYATVPLDYLREQIAHGRKQEKTNK